MVEALLGRGRHAAAASSSACTSAAEGNPLFLEQLVSMLVDEGAILRPTRATGDVADEVGELAGPADHQRAARGAPRPAGSRRARTSSSRPSVVGLEFPRAAVGWLAPAPVRRASSAGSAASTQAAAHPRADDGSRDGERSTASTTSSSGTRHTPASSSAPRGRSTSGSWSGPTCATPRASARSSSRRSWASTSSRRTATSAELGPLDEHGVALGIRASERLAAAGQARRSREATCPPPPTCCRGRPCARPVGDAAPHRAARRGRRGAHPDRRARARATRR